MTYCPVARDTANHCNQDDSAHTFNDLMSWQKEAIVDGLYHQAMNGKAVIWSSKRYSELLGRNVDDTRIAHKAHQFDEAKEDIDLVDSIFAAPEKAVELIKAHVEKEVLEVIKQALSDFNRAPDDTQFSDFTDTVQKVA